jgi:hypothetical protein
MAGVDSASRQPESNASRFGRLLMYALVKSLKPAGQKREIANDQ